MKGDLCSFDGCLNLTNCKGLCHSHYNQVSRGLTLRPIKYRSFNKIENEKLVSKGLRKCVSCGEIKELNFNNFVAKYELLTSSCITCLRKKNRESRIKRVLNTFKLYGSKCELCGHEDVRVLGFHHRNGGGTEDRKTNFGAIYKVNKYGYQPDLQLLCANCHAVITWNRGS